jgi:type VI protein secretion system component VasK
MRAFLTIIIPLLLPSAVYWMYLKFRQRQGLPFREVPWSWLIAAGVGLAVASLIVTWYADAAPTTGRYVPPQVIDGVVVPGHFVEEDAQ